MQGWKFFKLSERASATVEFGVLAVAVGTLGLVSATLMAKQTGPVGFEAVQASLTPPPVIAPTPDLASQISNIEMTAFSDPVAEDTQAPSVANQTYRAFRIMVDPMPQDDLARLYEGLPASLEMRLRDGDIAGAAEVVDALHAVDDAMHARGIKPPSVSRDSTADLEALYQKALN